MPFDLFAAIRGTHFRPSDGRIPEQAGWIVRVLGGTTAEVGGLDAEDIAFRGVETFSVDA